MNLIADLMWGLAVVCAVAGVTGILLGLTQLLLIVAGHRDQEEDEIMTMDRIERLAAEYAKRRDALRETVDTAQAAIDHVKRAYRADLRRRTGAAANARAELLAAIEAAPGLFSKPRTRLLSGIKVGWRKRPGRIEVSDESAAIEAIRRKLGEEAAEGLIQTREKLNRRGLRDLSARDLMRIGAVAVADADDPIAIPADSEIDKLVDALLDGAEQGEQEEAAA